MLCSIVFPLLGSGTIELELGLLDSDFFTRLIKIDNIFLIFFILGKTILRSSKFKDIEIWNQQYVDKQKDSRMFLIFYIYLKSVNFEMSIWHLQLSKNKKIQLYYSSQIISVHFLRESKMPNRHFEIY